MKLQPYLIYLLLTFSAVVFLSRKTIAQTSPSGYKIYGTVADSISKKPISLATISLNNENGKPIKPIFTAANGSFVLEIPTITNSKLTLIATGYQFKIINLKDSVKRSIYLDTVFMAVKFNRLKEVVVSAERPIIRQQADRIIYDLQADPESKGSNVLTMMRKVPFITVDASNNLLLKGNTSFTVLINGKPSGMLNNNFNAVLQSMPASTIQSIEVITNPPAKYDAEGLGGIINIVTNKKIDFGYKGSINMNQSFPVGGPGIGASFLGKQGKIGITGYGGLSNYYSPTSTYLNSRNTFGSGATALVQNGKTSSKNRNGYLGFEVSYEINPLNLLTGLFNINGSRFDGQTAQTSVLNESTTILQGYQLNNNNFGNGNGTDVGINYQLGFKADKNRLLTFSYHYFNYGNHQLNKLDIMNAVNYTQPNYQQDNNTQTSEKTFQIDYVFPIKKLTIESGIKGILRSNGSDYQYLLQNAVNGEYKLYPDFSDQFDYQQNVFSAYNSYRYNLKSWSFNAGLRAEQTVIDANFISTASATNQRVLNLIPSISLNKEFSDKSSISFSFNQRIKRPNIRRLNPFVDRSNPDFASSGNPNLRPVLNNNVQLSYSKSKKLSVTVSLGYSFIRNIDLKTSVFDSINNVTRITYQNTGKADRFGFDFNLNYPITNKWTISLNGNAAYFALSGLVNGALIRTNLFSDNISASSGYRFNKGWRLNASLTTISRSITDLQSTTNALIRSSFGLNKELVANKLTFSASVINPFNKYRNNITETKGPDFVQLGTNRDYYRSFSISLNYNFGKLKPEIKKNKRGINNDDGAR